jgi:hypothetical protein
MLAHASVIITYDTYSHVIPGMTEDATSKVAALFVRLHTVARDLDPLVATGLLWHLSDEERFLGSCFGLRWANYFLTAAHCVGTPEPREVGMMIPGVTRPIAAEHIERHESADVCVVQLPSFEDEFFEPFWGYVGNYGLTHRNDLSGGHPYGVALPLHPISPWLDDAVPTRPLW